MFFQLFLPFFQVAPQAFRRFGEGKAKGFTRNMDSDIVVPSEVATRDARHAMPQAGDVHNDVEVLLELSDGKEPSKEDRESILQKNFYEQQNSMVEAVNRGHKEGKHTWHAKRYEHRPLKMMGVLKESYKGLGKAERLELADFSAAEARKVDISDIPKEFDWGNVNGKNFVPGVRDQKCGSCYAFATRDMMEARTSILNKKPLEKMSVQSVLSCNAYSQGCAGGFPYTVAKFYQDVGAASDVDQPSNADSHLGEGSNSGTKPDKIKCDTKAKPMARAWSYKYVGGFYGATNHKSMLRDIYDHGPLAVCFEVSLGFGNYHGGIFKQADSLPIQDHYGRVNHAVLITGFGETKEGQKYWKVKNSWGVNWGDAGFFKIERGTNQLNMENDAVAVYPSDGPTMNTPVKMSLMESHGKMLLGEEEERHTALWREEVGDTQNKDRPEVFGLGNSLFKWMR